MRKVVVGVIAVVVIAIVAYIVLHREGHGGAESAGSAGGGSAAVRAPESPALKALDPKDPVVIKFQQRKAEALPHLQADLAQRLVACAGAGSGAPPAPRAVVAKMDWEPQLSTPELQRFVVADVGVVDANAPISAATARCFDAMKAATLNVLLPVHELPEGAHHLEEVVTLPLR
jgi:hypothetical protein